jgi:hypothetical protein
MKRGFEGKIMANRILQLRTITALAKGHGLKPLPFKLRTLGIALLILLGGLSMGANGAAGEGLLISLPTGIFLAYAIKANLEHLRKPEQWANRKHPRRMKHWI